MALGFCGNQRTVLPVSNRTSDTPKREDKRRDPFKFTVVLFAQIDNISFKIILFFMIVSGQLTV